MDRLDALLDRLPPIYTVDRGATLFGLLDAFAQPLRLFDEETDRVQRSHWIDTAFDRADLEKLGTLFGVKGAAFEPDELYRARLKATIAARLRGSVTRPNLELVLTRLLGAAQATLGFRYLQLLPESSLGSGASVFRTGPHDWDQTPAFVEFPAVRRRSPELMAAAGALRPLDRFPVVNRGKDPTFLEGILRGVAGHRTAMPVLVNLTNGNILGYVGVVGCGQELRLTAGADGSLSAHLDGADVSAQVYTSDGFQPSVPFTPLLPDPAPRAIRLEIGRNDLWFFSIALYDKPGLDSAMLAMASPDMMQGTFAGEGAGPRPGVYDQAVFFQPPAVVLDAFWTEHVPASFRFEIPTGAVRRTVGLSDDPERDHAQLLALLGESVDELRPAAVIGEVRGRPLADEQRMGDRLSVITPAAADPGSSGDDALAGLSFLFDLNALEGSRLQ